MKKCPFCSRKLGLLKSVNATSRYSYLICEYCLGGILDPQPRKFAIENVYKSKKYFSGLSSPQKSAFLQWFLTRRIYKTPAEWVRERFYDEPKKILDVGCGNGEFLEELQTAGYDVFGIDISKIAAENTQKRIGRNKAVSGKFLNYKFHRKFDLVSFWHLLEHLENPLEYLKKTKLLLRKDGLLIGEMPNFESPILRLFNKNYAWIIIPEHLIYFSEKSLRTLLRRSGFKSVEVYFPRRALLNFSFSLNNYLYEKNIPGTVRNILFVFSVPISVLLVSLFCSLRKGEVMRFVAKK